ncbi:MAG: hypothetical protein HQL73_01795 [Magnetococcales bacterium]|nr:hypothetical protein [Magnetococcales bacterium]
MSIIPLQMEYIQWHRRRLSEAMRRFQKTHTGPATMLLGFLFAHHWLKQEVHPQYLPQVAQILDHTDRLHPQASTWLIAAITLDDLRLMALVLEQLSSSSAPNARYDLTALTGDRSQFIHDLLQDWENLGLFPTSQKKALRTLGVEEKAIFTDLGGGHDRKRVELVDQLPDSSPGAPSFAKMALIPRLSCPQSCRHCMFIWRPSLKASPDPRSLLPFINQSTTHLLLTGGDLTPDLELFYHAIATMDQITTFAILLNGRLALSQQEAATFFVEVEHALKQRNFRSAQAKVLLQLSFDEFHQEIIANRHGELSERIPVACIARLLMASAGYSGCQVALIHKQNSLNFSTHVFEQGVFARLTRELALHGWKIQDILWQTSPRPKRHPVNPQHQAGVIREAHVSMIGPKGKVSFYFISSCVDAMGRAKLLDRTEFVAESLLLEQWLGGHPSPLPGPEPFDTDPMLWSNGHVTLFSASPMWMGNLLSEGPQIFTRWRKDPLLLALQRLDRRLIFAHEAFDPQKHQLLLAGATSPHHLLHSMIQEADARLFLTRWLLDNKQKPSSSP